MHCRRQVKLPRPCNHTIYYGHLTKKRLVTQMSKNSSKRRWVKFDDTLNAVLKPHPESMLIL